LCSAAMMVDEKQRDGGGRSEQFGGYERIWVIGGATCMIEFGRPRFSLNTCWIGTRTCSIGDGQLRCTQYFPKFQFLMMISPASSHLSLSRPQFYHHLWIRT
jgi:hypothetical protein